MTTACLSHSVTHPEPRPLASDAGGVPGRYKLCENCGRNFFRCVQSQATLCCMCRDISRGGSGHQLWTCEKCGTFRAWGMNAPAETAAKLLRCAHCSSTMLHFFWKVA